MAEITGVDPAVEKTLELTEERRGRPPSWRS
jgi:hypothetical protein